VSNFQVWVVILNGNKVFIITTRNFLPELGGMQILMSDIARHLSQFNSVKVFAEYHKHSIEFDNNQKYEIERVKGFKFIRKFRKANQIEQLYHKNKNITAIISDHWKSIEKLSKNLCNEVPTLCLIHGKEINHQIKSPLNIRMINSLKKSKYIISNSDFTKKLAISKGLPEQKIITINPGIDLNDDDLDESTAMNIFDTNGPKIITVCRLEKRKGLEQTILALKNFQSKYKNFKFVIVGDGVEKLNLENQVRELDLNKNVIFLNDVSLKLKNSLIKVADFFIMPSIQVGKSVEGFGISFLESAKYGTPSIGGVVGGASDIIKHNETGILCDGEKHEEIYHSLIKMMEDNNYKIFGENSKKISKNFSWDIQIKKYLNLIDKK
jgi:phosphatidylinositol alpha-1,6-mannosyltransferase